MVIVVPCLSERLLVLGFFLEREICEFNQVGSGGVVKNHWLTGEVIVQSEVEGASGSDQHVGQVGMVDELLAMVLYEDVEVQSDVHHLFVGPSYGVELESIQMNLSFMVFCRV